MAGTGETKQVFGAIRPNESPKNYYSRIGDLYKLQSDLSAEKARMARDPNKSKGMSQREKEDAMSEEELQMNYGPFTYSGFSSGGTGGKQRQRMLDSGYLK